MYIGDYLARRELYSPDRLAIIDSGKDPEWRLTFRQVNVRANRLANWLRDAAGVGKDDRVAILAHDGVEHLDTFFACGKLGAIHTALNWRLHPQELAGIVAATTPRVLIFSAELAEKVAALQELLDGRPEAIAHKVKGEDGQAENRAGPHQEERLRVDVRPCIVDHAAPTWSWWGNSNAQKTQCRFGKDCPGKVYHADREQNARKVRQNMPRNDQAGWHT